MKTGTSGIILSLFLSVTFFEHALAQNAFTISTNSLSRTHTIIRTPDYGYLLLGNAQLISGTSLIKLDSALNIEWERNFYGSEFYVDESKDALLAKPGGGYYYVDVWDYESMSGPGPFCTYHYFSVNILNDSGNITGYSRFDGIHPDDGYKIFSFNVNSLTGDYILTGLNYILDDNTCNVTSQTSIVMKFDSLHNGIYALNSNTLVPGNPTYTNAKDLYFPGNNYETLIVGEQFAMKIDSSQNILWQHSYTDPCNGLIVQEDSNTFVFQNHTPWTGNDTKVRKMDYNGNTIFTKNIPGMRIVQAEKSGGHLMLSGTYQGLNRCVILKTDLALNVIESYQVDSIYNWLPNHALFSFDQVDSGFLWSESVYNPPPGYKLFKKHYLDTMCGATPLNITTTATTSSQQQASYNFTFYVPSSVVYPYPVYTTPAQIAVWGCQPFVGIDNYSNPNSNLAISPNPASATFKLTHQFKKGDQVLICDAIAKTVLSHVVNEEKEEVQMDLSEVPNGIYFIRLISKDKSITQKLVVQH